MHTFWHVNVTSMDWITKYITNSINDIHNEAKKLELEAKVVVAI
jgi:hypothetical protein